ncbi:MAG TPA: DNA primase, partial [Ruminococcus sp.]|nr:DNA primase [Ruminococcus sp.]
MQKNDEFLYQLKSANPIETVVGSYVNLLRQGHNYVCACPFHSEKTPSCTVFTDTQSFYCFGCGAGGDVI